MTAATLPAPEHTAMGRLLDVIERAGNKVPHPVMMFLYLIIGVILLSAALALAGVSVTDQIVVPDAAPVTPNYYEDSTQPILDTDVPDYIYEDGFHLEEVTVPIRSLLDAEGIRFLFTSFVPNFAGFGVIAVTFVALMGAGVAEASGLMAALIRLLVGASPRRLLVVGEAGAGKTVLAVHLLLDQLRDRAALTDNLRIDTPVPVRVNVAGWDGGGDFTSWMASRLKTDYGLPPKVALALTDAATSFPSSTA